MSREGVIRGPGEHTTITSTSTYTGNSTFELENFYKGKGVIVQGNIVQVRNHTLTAGTKVFKFLAVVVDVTNIRKRSFNDNGTEIEKGDPLDTIERKGFLTTERKRVADPDKLTSDGFKALIGDTLPKGTYDSQLKNLHPNVLGRFEFWAELAQFKYNLLAGNNVRLKTKGDRHKFINIF